MSPDNLDYQTQKFKEHMLALGFPEELIDEVINDES